MIMSSEDVTDGRCDGDGRKGKEMKWMMWWVSIDGALIDDRIMEIMGLRSASLVRAEGRGPGPLLPWKMDKNGEQVGPSYPRAAAQWSVITDHWSAITGHCHKPHMEMAQL